MLDPISAVGIAAATVQFIDFTTKLLAVGKEVHGSARGTTDELVHLDEVYSDLKKLSLKLSQSATSNHSTPSEFQELSRLATLCHHECDHFITAIEKLSNKNGTRRTFKSLRQALAIVWSRKTMECLEMRLERCQRELTLALIAHLSNGQSSISRGLQSLIADNRRQTEDIARLFDELKAYHKAKLFQGQDPSFQSVSSALGSVAMMIPWAFHVAAKVIRHQRLLHSLYFPQLKVRHSRIEKAHERTFKWLFQESRKGGHNADPRHRFVKWLRSGEGIFWISGKPGSGKSTLMKWVCSQQRTREILFQWANPTLDLESPDENRTGSKMAYFAPLDAQAQESLGETRNETSDNDILQELHDGYDDSIRVVTASFYFWSAGTSMQKSQQGLFQSLLYEIFSHAPDLMQEACPLRWQATEFGDFQEPWTMNEISETIQRAISFNEATVRFCFFVDGIDEYSGDHSAMVRLLENFARLPNVKLCLSSRPWNVFEDAFGATLKNKFYLQDLTRADIKQYVRSKLTRHPAWKSLSHSNAEYDAIATEIMEKAQGVFLWVFLVVRSLLDGLTNGDTVSLLQERLRHIPTDLREYFKYILDSLDPIYNIHVAHFFLEALDSPEPLPLMMYSFFEDEFDRSDYVHELDMTALELYEIIPRHKQTERRLNGRCKGLLEVYRDPDGLDLFRYRVGFLHRTVRDFFMTKEMRQEFEERLPEKLQICLSMVKACIAMMKKTPRIGQRLGKNTTFGYLVDTAMLNARRAELLNGAPATRLLDELSFVLESVGFYKDYWTNGDGDHKDMFLGLTIERGISLYASQQLKYLAPGSIATKKLRYNGRKHLLLESAVGLSGSLDHTQFDVSDIMLFLLTNGCDPNSLLTGNTPFSTFLHLIFFDDLDASIRLNTSVRRTRVRMLKQLLNNGANPNHRSKNSEWPLWATWLFNIQLGENMEMLIPYYLEVIEILLSFGADPNLACEKGCDRSDFI